MPKINASLATAITELEKTLSVLAQQKNNPVVESLPANQVAYNITLAAGEISKELSTTIELIRSSESDDFTKLQEISATVSAFIATLPAEPAPSEAPAEEILESIKELPSESAITQEASVLEQKEEDSSTN